MVHGRLTMEDVEALRRDRSAANRAATAERVSQALASSDLRDSERGIAEDIVRLLLRDAEVLVRRKLSELLCGFPDLPKDIVRTLAQDEFEVADLVLRESTVLGDDDLIEIIHRCSVSHAVAIAKRPFVSATVSTELVVRNDERVLAALLGNRNAVMDEPAQHLIINAHANTPRIMDALAVRAALPNSVVERLVTVVSEHVATRLLETYRVSPRHRDLLTVHAREHMLLTTMVEGATQEMIGDAVDVLREQDRLTPTLIVRALCLGDLDFVRFAMARLAEVPVDNATRLLSDRGRSGAEQFFSQCGLPESLRPVFQAVMSLVRRHQYTGDTRERSLFRNSVYAWGLGYLGLEGSVLGHDQLITRVLIYRPERPTGRRGRTRHRALD